MRHVSIAVIAAATTISLTQIATAADITRPVYKAPVPIPVQDWSGIYVGLEGGYGWGHQSFDQAFDPFGIPSAVAWVEIEQILAPTIDSVHQNGWLFGGFAGAQKQWGSAVLGIEADFDGADIKGSAASSASLNNVDYVCNTYCGKGSVSRSVAIESKIDELASLRGKIGWAFAPNWLIYGTGGAAWAHVKNTVTLSETVIFPTVETETYTESASGGTSMFGWAAGAGVDWKWPIDAGSAVIFGVEYLHYGFPADTLTLADNFGDSIAINAKQSVDTVKGRISYLFSIH
jgi:outer membrane immunogenic protein